MARWRIGDGPGASMSQHRYPIPLVATSGSAKLDELRAHERLCDAAAKGVFEGLGVDDLGIDDDGAPLEHARGVPAEAHEHVFRRSVGSPNFDLEFGAVCLRIAIAKVVHVAATSNVDRLDGAIE